MYRLKSCVFNIINEFTVSNDIVVKRMGVFFLPIFSSHSFYTAEFIRWRPIDDAQLISSMQQVGDILTVHLATKFSRPYALKEVKERWKALLYDKSLSK